MRIFGFDIVRAKELDIQRANEYRVLMRDIRKALTNMDNHTNIIRTSANNLNFDCDSVEQLKEIIETNGKYAECIGKGLTDNMDTLLTLCQLMKALSDNAVVTPHVILASTKVMESVHIKNTNLMSAINEYGNSSMQLYAYTEMPDQMVQAGMIQMTMMGCAKSLTRVKAMSEILKHEVHKLHTAFIEENVWSAKSPHEIVKHMKEKQRKPLRKKLYSVSIYKEEGFPWEPKKTQENEKEGKESNG
jgi:energy-converting hydrogenase A subunit M